MTRAKIKLGDPLQSDPLDDSRGEGKQHAKLKMLAKQFLLDRGYDQVQFEVQILERQSPGGYPIADVVGFNGTKVACVECTVGPFTNTLDKSKCSNRSLAFPFDEKFVMQDIDGNITIDEVNGKSKNGKGESK